MQRCLLLMLKITTLSFFLCLSLSHFHVSLAKIETTNPLTAKASAIRYWNRHIITARTLPPPDFLISKMSPLSAVEAAFFARLAEEQVLSSYLPTFCSSANLFCSFDDTSSEKATSSGKEAPDANFAMHSNEKFTNYGSSQLGTTDLRNAAKNSVAAYTSNSNNPTNNFKNCGAGGNSAIDTFTSYRDGANDGHDSFQSCARNANSAKANFANNDKTFSGGTNTFKEYGSGSKGHTVEFKSYIISHTFKEYATNGVPFAQYTKGNSPKAAPSKANNISIMNTVEEGQFFREDMLKQGMAMKMPDIRDKMPKRSFLPRGILSKLPFSTSGMENLKRIFAVKDNSTTERVIINAVSECEQAPSKGETKRCVGSVEDMIDFATSVLGKNIIVRTTKNTNGSKGSVIIGEVMGINGGKVTKLVSCHQSLYPYLLYYCHSVPKVRLYVADILDVKTKVKINQGVAICHRDTSAWSPTHGAFVALGSEPGLIEVCHWIFENDMTWTTED